MDLRRVFGVGLLDPGVNWRCAGERLIGEDRKRAARFQRQRGLRETHGRIEPVKRLGGEYQVEGVRFDRPVLECRHGYLSVGV